MLPLYDPLDKEALVTQYSDILRAAPPLGKDALAPSVAGRGEPQESGDSTAAESNNGIVVETGPGIPHFIEMTEKNAKKGTNPDHKICEMIQVFRGKLGVEVGNLGSKRKIVQKKEAGQKAFAEQDLKSISSAPDGGSEAFEDRLDR